MSTQAKKWKDVLHLALGTNGEICYVPIGSQQKYRLGANRSEFSSTVDIIVD